MTKIFESDIEKLAIELLESQGYKYLSPEEQEAERLPASGAGKSNLSEVILKERLKSAIEKINPKASEAAKDQALRQVLNLSSRDLVDNNEKFHRMLTEGIEVEVMGKGGVKGGKVQLIDFEDIKNNDFVVCNQFTVVENLAENAGEAIKRPDVVLFVNGLPLVVVELKNPADEKAKVEKAFTQLQNYKSAIPTLFNYNSILVISDGHDAKAGTITSGWSRFSAWKTTDGKKETKATIPQIETLIKGMLVKEVLLDLVRHFTVFEKSKREDKETGQIFIETDKKIAAYHQYYAVKKAIESTKKATARSGNRKAGVIWHTQGSGKSLSMIFYAGKIVLELDNPTILVITDRNDLDGQLFDTFAGCKMLLRQEPVQAESREDLKKKLKTAGGGIIFTTIQKFMPEGESEKFDLLSERQNIIVIADEAHRSQYGFKAKTLYKKG